MSRLLGKERWRDVGRAGWSHSGRRKTFMERSRTFGESVGKTPGLGASHSKPSTGGERFQISKQKRKTSLS
ncbi:hypothetical protein Naga_103373g1 [Nannochloropsis gaditana]|uniref:Uncharacterized protein n=1 Tax=Nannochloropsis gaditana TaxID=72520 RepID=W7TBQ1_9STRA|nr:hypothetical protein Naga_103373g1 [Nannochloropsis gaditana]